MQLTGNQMGNPQKLNDEEDFVGVTRAVYDVVLNRTFPRRGMGNPQKLNDEEDFVGVYLNTYDT